jgi:hypothetical protein
VKGGEVLGGLLPAGAPSWVPPVLFTAVFGGSLALGKRQVLDAVSPSCVSRLHAFPMDPDHVSVVLRSMMRLSWG